MGEETMHSILLNPDGSAKSPLDEITENKERIILDVVDYLEMEEEENPYIIDKIIPKGSITALTSDTGKGKSVIMMLWLSAILRGEMIFGKFKTEKMKILLIDLEMTKNTIIRRTKRIIGTDYKERGNLFISRGNKWKLDNDEDLQWAIKFITDNGIGLLVIDTLSKAHSADENSATEMTIIYERMFELTEKTGATVFFLHHHRKLQQGEKSSIASARGSTAIIDNVASHLLLESSPKHVEEKNGQLVKVTEMILSQKKMREEDDMATIKLKIWIDPVENRTKWEYCGEVLENPKTTEAKEWVLSMLEQDTTKTWNQTELETMRKVAKNSKVIDFGKDKLLETLELLETEKKINVWTNGGSKQNAKSYTTVRKVCQEVLPDIEGIVY